MSFLIAQAYAASSAPANGQDSLLSMLPMMMVFFGLMYFMVVRPQQKKAADHKALLADLQPGDEIVTIGGIIGEINDIKDNFATLKVAEGVQMTIQKSSIASMLPKGSLQKPSA